MGEIHRKKTYQQLRELFDSPENITEFTRDSMELALKVIESQENLIQSLVEKKKNLQKLCRRLEELRTIDEKRIKQLESNQVFWKNVYNHSMERQLRDFLSTLEPDNYVKRQ